VVLPERDKLVPKEGAAALLAQLPQADRHDAPSGHIGMVVGPRAEAGLWQPLADWLTVTARRAQDTEQNGLPQRRRRGAGKSATKVRG